MAEFDEFRALADDRTVFTSLGESGRLVDDGLPKFIPAVHEGIKVLRVLERPVVLVDRPVGILLELSEREFSGLRDGSLHRRRMTDRSEADDGLSGNLFIESALGDRAATGLGTIDLRSEERRVGKECRL